MSYIFDHTLYLIYIGKIGGQNGAAVARPHGKVQVVGSNPALARN